MRSGRRLSPRTLEEEIDYLQNRVAYLRARKQQKQLLRAAKAWRRLEQAGVPVVDFAPHNPQTRDLCLRT